VWEHLFVTSQGSALTRRRRTLDHEGDNVQKVTGAPPIKFADFARRTAQAWT
jgi:hypothetical protein